MAPAVVELESDN